jgi:hypothetical protein
VAGALPHPDLAPDVEHLGMLVVQRPQGAAVVAPQVPAVADVLAQGRDVAGQDRQVDVLVLAQHSGERLDRPAADDPPGTFEAGHELRETWGVERVPGAIEPEELPILRDLLRRAVEWLPHLTATSATTARWSVSGMSTV